MTAPRPEFGSVLGVEIELGVILQDFFQHWRQLDITTIMELLRPLDEVNGFHANGMRIYPDQGKIEGATSEGATGRDVAIQSRSFLELACELAREYSADPRGRPIRLVANNSARLSASSKLASGSSGGGYHENLLINRATPMSAVLDQLLPYLWSRIIWSGAGMVLPADGFFGQDMTSWRYCLAQRPFYISRAFSSGRLEQLGMIRDRDVPLGDMYRYRRLEINCGEDSILFAADELGLELDALMGLMVDAGVLADAPVMNQATLPELFQELSLALGPDLDHAFDGSPELLSQAIETQRWYLQRAQEFVALHSLDSRFGPMLARWEFVLKALREHRFRELIGLVDWVTKWDIIERASSSNRSGYNFARWLDLEYHCVYGGKLQWPQRLWAAYDPPGLDVLIKRHKEWALPGRRGVMRGEIQRAIVRTEYRKLDISLGWDGCFLGLIGGYVAMDDPFATSSPDVDACLKALRSAA